MGTPGVPPRARLCVRAEGRDERAAKGGAFKARDPNLDEARFREFCAVMLTDGRDDDAAILRVVHEAAPDTRYVQLAAFQLKLTDPPFAAKLVEAPRAGPNSRRS